MSALSSMKSAAMAAAHRIAEAHRRRATTRAVESLPLHIQKDIGWVNGSWSGNGRRGR
jgi:hypothetical protein